MPERTALPIASRRANAASSSNSIAASPARIVTGLAENVPPCGSAGLPALGSNTAMNSRAAADRADRKTAADDLAERRQIGIDAPYALRAAIAEPEGDDFVEDQQRPDLARDLGATPRDSSCRPAPRPGAVRHRIDQHAGQLGAVLADQADRGLRIVERKRDHIGQHVLRRALGDRRPTPGVAAPASGVGSRLTSA